MDRPEEEENRLSNWPYMSLSSLSTSFLIKLGTVGIIWGWGYMNLSLAWLIGPVVLSVWRTERKKDHELKRLMAQATALSKEKDIIASRMDELPSWVYFPDFDRAEWLNKILYKVWPSINHFVRDLFKSTIQPAIVQSLSEYKMKGFQFERLVLGRIPPKIYGIKAYDKNTSRHEVIFDVDILYAGDCDISFTVGNFKGGIKDFQLRGLMRVVLKPLIPVMPLVGGVQAFFLNNPAIDFNLVGAADILDFPGFNDLLRKIITQQVAARLVLPNKIIIPLSEDIPSEVLKMPEPEGVLRIHVVQAKHLMKKDIGVLGKGKSDPYAVISVGAQEFRTKTIDNTVDPKWDYWCEFIVDEGLGPNCKIHLFDKDNTGQDDQLGRATIEVSRVKKKGTIDTWISLELAKHGMVHLRLTWLQLSNKISDLPAALKETQQLRVTSMSTAVLILYIDSAKNLPCIKGSKQPDVYLEANLGGKTERTITILRSCDPVWEQGFTFLVANPETGTMTFKITDEKSGMTVGTLNFNVSTLLEKANFELKQSPFDLEQSGRESKLVMSMILKILKYEPPKASSDDEDDPENNESHSKMERQGSTISNLSSSVPPSPLKKQLSKESLQSAGSNASANRGTNIPTLAEVPPPEYRFPPIEEPAVRETAPTQTSANPNLVHRHPSFTSSTGDSKLGRIQLTLQYSEPRQKLFIHVHKVAHLPLPQNDPHNIPDPYVKLYLLPDKHKETKRKTIVIKDNCNPVFDEKFEYIVSQGDINSKTLEISVCTQKAWLSTGNNIMGQIHIDLSQIDFSQSVTSWFDLQPEIKD
ncbi:extended synaptotagmin-1 isoform X2 [Leptopilina heterotoma]|uniref:extended synaptotagmin-1 isoform X2 n=1 Tax=Leptopilina heterotoma TaxID=63436 RepID=UPI001CA9B618|nr:extended synaptotagmin-1 isoform X2 [Leptopilina heterotoma]